LDKKKQPVDAIFKLLVPAPSILHIHVYVLIIPYITCQEVFMTDKQYHKEAVLEEELQIPFKKEEAIFRCKIVQKCPSQNAKPSKSSVVVTCEHYALDGNKPLFKDVTIM
jgi:hypothetical protein